MGGNRQATAGLRRQGAVIFGKGKTIIQLLIKKCKENIIAEENYWISIRLWERNKTSFAFEFE